MSARGAARRRKNHLINTLLGKVFGTKNEREIKRMVPRVEAIGALEPEMKKLSDEQLIAYIRAARDEGQLTCGRRGLAILAQAVQI